MVYSFGPAAAAAATAKPLSLLKLSSRIYRHHIDNRCEYVTHIHIHKCRSVPSRNITYLYIYGDNLQLGNKT